MRASGRFRLDEHGPPGAWLPAHRLREAVTGPIERFLQLETASGITLIAATVVALAWANSPWRGSYEALWHTPIVLGVGSLRLEQPLHFWINEFLMTLFFLVAGNEIRRELAVGALSDLRRAALPLAAALGGMLLPALIYLAFNAGTPAHSGWGIPMATDVAFAVGLIALLGRCVPPALRVLLLALAVIDDLGAILVIAIFYSHGIDPRGLLSVGGGLLLLLSMRWAGVRPGPAFFFPLAVLWFGLYTTGVHPTVAGVIVAMTTPVKPWLDRRRFLQIARGAIDTFQRRMVRGDDDERLLEPLTVLTQAGQEAISPTVRAQAGLHFLVAFVILPLFALANAGVYLGDIDLSIPGSGRAAAGIAIGLAIGKPLGVLSFSWLAVRLGLARLPRGLDWSAMWVLGAAAGIGFTMSIFVAELAFGNHTLLGVAKLAILGGSLAAALGGYFIGRCRFQGEHHDDLSETEVEQSDEVWTVGNSPPLAERG